MSRGGKIPSKIGPYILRGTIGEGAFSIVKLAFHEQLRAYYACKIIPKSRLTTPSLEKRFEEEIRINQQLHHPGVVNLVDIIKDEYNYYVVMEFCPNGELFQYIVDRGRLLEEEAQPKIRMILDTIKYIHSLGIAHRDLKPENILLDQYGQPKISDFGLSRFVSPGNFVSTPCGSPCYASPECISGSAYNGLTSDIWSCGVVLFAMVTGQLPWTKRNQNQLFEQIRHGDYTIPDYLSLECASMIQGLMTVETDQRLTIEEALQHPWLHDITFMPPAQSFNMSISMKRIDSYFGKNISDPDLTKLKPTKSIHSITFEQTMGIIINSKVVSVKNRKKRRSSSKITTLETLNHIGLEN